MAANKIGARTNQMAIEGKKAPPKLRIPAMINNLDPKACVLAQTVGLLSVQGVRMPIVQFISALPIKMPVKINRTLKAGAIYSIKFI